MQSQVHVHQQLLHLFHGMTACLFFQKVSDDILAVWKQEDKWKNVVDLSTTATDTSSPHEFQIHKLLSQDNFDWGKKPHLYPAPDFTQQTVPLIHDSRWRLSPGHAAGGWPPVDSCVKISWICFRCLTAWQWTWRKSMTGWLLLSDGNRVFYWFSTCSEAMSELFLLT